MGGKSIAINERFQSAGRRTTKKNKKVWNAVDCEMRLEDIAGQRPVPPWEILIPGQSSSVMRVGCANENVWADYIFIHH